MPENRYFYGNIWQIMAIKNLLQYRYQLIIKLLQTYMAIWQFFYEKKHQSIIIKSQTRGVSLFIGLRGINGTLTAFLGLLTDFKRKLDLTVMAIPPKAGALRR